RRRGRGAFRHEARSCRQGAPLLHSAFAEWSRLAVIVRSIGGVALQRRLAVERLLRPTATTATGGGGGPDEHLANCCDPDSRSSYVLMKGSGPASAQLRPVT